MKYAWLAKGRGVVQPQVEQLSGRMMLVRDPASAIEDLVYCQEGGALWEPTEVGGGGMGLAWGLRAEEEGARLA